MSTQAETIILIERFLLRSKEDGGMSVVELQHLAAAVEVTDAKLIQSEEKLIRLIQNVSQQRSCFRSKKRTICQETDCVWQAECKKLIAHWK